MLNSKLETLLKTDIKTEALNESFQDKLLEALTNKDKRLGLGQFHPEHWKLYKKRHTALIETENSDDEDEKQKETIEGTGSRLGLNQSRYPDVCQKRDKVLEDFPGNVMMQTGSMYWIQMQGPTQNFFEMSHRTVVSRVGDTLLEYNQKGTSVASVFTGIFAKTDNPIIVVLGKPEECGIEKYSDYKGDYRSFSNFENTTNVEIVTQLKRSYASGKISDYLKIHDATFRISKAYDKCQNTRIIEFCGVADGRSLQANDLMTLAIIRYLADNSDKHHVVVHCSAGIGRSGMFTFATYLTKHYDKIFTDDETQTRNNIIDALNRLNSSDPDEFGRPGTVQKKEQLLCAINIAKNIKANEVLLNKICNNEEFKDLVASHKTDAEATQAMDSAKQTSEVAPVYGDSDVADSGSRITSEESSGVSPNANRPLPLSPIDQGSSSEKSRQGRKNPPPLPATPDSKLEEQRVGGDPQGLDNQEDEIRVVAEKDNDSDQDRSEEQSINIDALKIRWEKYSKRKWTEPTRAYIFYQIDNVLNEYGNNPDIKIFINLQNSLVKWLKKNHSYETSINPWHQRIYAAVLCFKAELYNLFNVVDDKLCDIFELLFIIHLKLGKIHSSIPSDSVTEMLQMFTKAKMRYDHEEQTYNIDRPCILLSILQDKAIQQIAGPTKNKTTNFWSSRNKQEQKESVYSLYTVLARINVFLEQEQEQAEEVEGTDLLTTEEDEEAENTRPLSLTEAIEQINGGDEVTPHEEHDTRHTIN